MNVPQPAFARPVLVGKDGSEILQRIRMSEFSERWLQELIHRQPNCLPIDEIEPGFGPLVSICMELPTAHGSIDNLLLTPEGDIVIVEAKLWRNPEARRKVVAQALDYAVCLFGMRYSDLERAILKSDLGGGRTPRPREEWSS
jgi:hypothetical protein